MKLKEKTNYQDDIQLRKRKRIYNYVRPRIDTEEEIIKLISPNSSVLDVGCGNGDLLIRMRKQGFSNRLIGIDISEGILQPGINQNKEEDLNIVFKVGNAEKLEFPDNALDVIISKHVLYHVKDIKAAVAEAYRCLRPGGLFIASLNSRLENKPKLTDFYEKIEKKFDLKIQRGQDELSIEDFMPFLSEFKEKKLLKFQNFVELKDAKPYVDYLDSVKDFFEPYPNNNQWEIILKEFEGIINNEIENNNVFKDKNVFGIFAATK